jgi:hypothetical protein
MYKLDLVGVQEVRWDKEGTVRAGDYTFLYGKGNENHQLGTRFFVHQRIVPAVKKVELVSDRMSFVVLRGRWCNIIFLNAHSLTEEKNDDSKDSLYEELEQVKILLGEFNAKLGREDIFKPTFGNESLHEDSNENGVRVVNIATSKNLVVKSTMFPHRNIHKYIWTSPDGKNHNQIDHVFHDPLGARGSTRLRGSAVQLTVGAEWAPSELLRRVRRFSLQAPQVPAS